MYARVICESGVRNCQLNCPWCARSMSLVRSRETHPVRGRWRVYNQIMYNAKVKVPWLIGTKHFPESKRVLDSGNSFVIISVLDSAKCFGFWDVFRILGSVLSLREVSLCNAYLYKFPNSLDTSLDLSRPNDLRANHILYDKFKYKSQLHFPSQITGTCTKLT